MVIEKKKSSLFCCSLLLLAVTVDVVSSTQRYRKWRMSLDDYI